MFERNVLRINLRDMSKILKLTTRLLRQKYSVIIKRRRSIPDCENSALPSHGSWYKRGLLSPPCKWISVGNHASESMKITIDWLEWCNKWSSLIDNRTQEPTRATQPPPPPSRVTYYRHAVSNSCKIFVGLIVFIAAKCRKPQHGEFALTNRPCREFV
jgi:hypothetical protein